MRYEEFVRLEKGDRVRVRVDGHVHDGEIAAVSVNKGRACVSLEPGSGGGYRAVFVWRDYIERRK